MFLNRNVKMELEMGKFWTFSCSVSVAFLDWGQFSVRGSWSNPRSTPPPSTPIEPGGTYARSPSPAPPPPYLGEKDIPPTSGIGYHWQLQKNTPLGLSPGGGGGTQMLFGRGCAAEASNPVPIFKGHLGGKGYTTNELDPMKWSILLPRCDKNDHYPSQRRG